MKEREHWADIAKGIGIILVILGHIKYTNLHITKWIYTFHMPLFFFISGYFINKRNSFFLDIKHKAYILLVPYFILSIIEFALEDLLNIAIGRTPTYLTTNRIIGLFVQLPNPNIYETQFWFFGCLFITSIILLTLVYIFKENKYRVIVSSMILMIFGTIFIKIFNIRIFWNIDIALIMSFYAACGYFLKQSQMLNKYHKLDKKLKILVVTICGILGLAFMNKIDLDGHIDYYTRIIGQPFFTYMSGICNILFIVLLSKSIEGYFEKNKSIVSKIIRSEDIEFIGKNSGAYYVLSAWGIHVGYFAILILKSIYEIRSDTIYMIITFSVAIIVPIPIILILNKALPKVFGRGTIKKE